VHDLLLQKSGGAFELVVWGEQIAGTNKITVNLERTRKQVAIYDTTAGTAPIEVLTDTSNFPVMISDHALIIEIQ
jgi:hypothetical protein